MFNDFHLCSVWGVCFYPFSFFQGEKKVANIENVFAVIKGSEEPDRYVLLGNHRDAWTYGAVDPSSGTAALLDIARRFSVLLGLGWKPRRTIILCSWDAEEFGMVSNFPSSQLIFLHSNVVSVVVDKLVTCNFTSMCYQLPSSAFRYTHY